MDIALREQLFDQWIANGTLPHYPKGSDDSFEISNNGPALGVGGGFDVVLARPFAWRLLKVEFCHVWMGNVVIIQPQNGLRVSTGAVHRDLVATSAYPGKELATGRIDRKVLMA